MLRPGTTIVRAAPLDCQVHSAVRGREVVHVKKINQENDGNSKRGAGQVGSPRLLGGARPLTAHLSRGRSR